MNSNDQLFFTTLGKHAWATFKKRWAALYALAMVPVIFGVSVYIIISSILYLVARFSGEENPFVVVLAGLRYVTGIPTYICAIVAVVVVVGAIYFSLKALIASVKILESSGEKLTIRKAWQSAKLKSVLSLFAVILVVALVIIGGYIMLLLPMIFLATFYCLAVFTNVIEGKKGISALTASRHYIRGYGANVFVNLLFVAIISMLVAKLVPFIFFSFNLLKLLTAYAYFGNVSLVAGLTLSLVALLLVLAVLVIVFWKAFSIVFLYSMYKKLHSLKAETSEEVSTDKKVAKFWIVVSIIFLAIAIGVGFAMKDLRRNSDRYYNGQDRMMYDNSNGFMDGDIDYSAY